MKKAFAWVFALACCGALLGGLSACEKKPEAEKKAAPAPAQPIKMRAQTKIELSASEREELLKIARKAFDVYVTEHRKLEASEAPASLRKPSNVVFATIYKDGEWRGCVAGSGKDVVEASINAVINTCNDKRFKNPAPEELDRFRLELSVLLPEEPVESKDPAEIGKILEPGVHGIIVRHSSGREAFFLPYVFVKTQRDTTTWLERLCVKGGLDKDAWKTPEVAIFRFGTINFIEESAHGKALSLYRYKVELDHFTLEDLADSNKAARAWFEGHLDAATNRLSPGLNGGQKQPIADTPQRQLAGLAAFAYAADLARDPVLGKRVERALRPFLDVFEKQGPEGLKDEGFSEPSFEQNVILADLCGISGVMPERNKSAKRFMGYFAGLWRKDKRFPTPVKPFIDDTNNYAIMVTARLAQMTKSPEDLALVRELAATGWQSGKLFSLPAAVSLALTLDSEESKKRVASEVEVWLKHQTGPQTEAYRDFIGSFDGMGPITTLRVAVPLMGLARAVPVLLQSGTDPAFIARIGGALLLGGRYLLEQQFSPQSAFYLPDHAQYEGAFKQDLLVHVCRLEDSAYAWRAMLDIEREAQAVLAQAVPRSAELLKK